MSTPKTRLDIAVKILAGFAANPAVFAPNPTCGWSLCNCTDEDVTGYALHLADRLIDAESKLSTLDGLTSPNAGSAGRETQ